MVRMSRLTGSGLSLILGLVVVTRAFAQGGENNDWQKINDERDARRKAELIESFVKTYPNSPHRPDADFILVDYYQSNKDNGKIMQHAESFRLTVPSADNAAKSKIYTQAMLAAATLNNVPKTVEYGGYALQADPNNLTVLVFFAGSNLPDPAKALEHAQKAVSVSRPAAMTEAQYTTMQARMHGVLAKALFGQQKFVEANEHFAVALKTNPKDHVAQFQFGVSSVALAQAAANSAQIANNDLIKVMTATPTDPQKVEEAKAKVDAASKEALTHRDNAVDAMARAIALGGQYAAQAKQLLDSLYKNKTGSLDGEDQYIAQKKTELGL